MIERLEREGRLINLVILLLGVVLDQQKSKVISGFSIEDKVTNESITMLTKVRNCLADLLVDVAHERVMERGRKIEEIAGMK